MGEEKKKFIRPSFDSSHRDADTDSVNTMVVHEDEGEEAEGEQAGGYGDQTMLVQRVSHLYVEWSWKCTASEMK